MKSLFPAKGRWFKGMLHVHSTESDGWISPERVLIAYQDKGYDFLCLTDHWMVTKKPKKVLKNMLFLSGVELDGGDTGVGDYHFVGIDVKAGARFKKKKESKDYTPRELVDLIRSRGGLAVIAHPSWNGVSWVNLVDVAEDLFGLEVWNTGCDVEIGRGRSEVQWDDLLSRGYMLHGLAVDDTHRYYRDAAKAWVMVKAPALTKKAIRSALEKGAFYSSTGPSIHDLKLSGNRIAVRTSPVKRIDLVCSPTKGRTVTAHEGNFLTEYSFSYFRKYSRYLRIRIKDECGQYAWTNPIFL